MSFINRQVLPVFTDHLFALFSLCHMLQPTHCYFCPPGIILSSQFLLFSQEKNMSQPYTSWSEQQTVSSLPWAGQTLPHTPGQVQGSGFAGRFWESCLMSRRTGNIDPRPVLALHFASPALLHFLLFLFFTDTGQKKNNPAPSQTF